MSTLDKCILDVRCIQTIDDRLILLELYLKGRYVMYPYLEYPNQVNKILLPDYYEAPYVIPMYETTRGIVESAA